MTTQTIIEGKWYVVDQLDGPVEGPFDTKEQAESERVQLNCADDCFTAQKKKSNRIRMVIDGESQYTAIVQSKEAYPLDATTEYSDWFSDDAAAEAGYRSLMEGQGYKVASVKIGFPCVVVLQ